MAFKTSKVKKNKTTQGVKPPASVAESYVAQLARDKGASDLRLALIESATRVVIAANVPDACATAMAYLNHHYAADLPSPPPVSADPVSPGIVDVEVPSPIV